MLHLTKVAFGVSSLEDLEARLVARAESGTLFLATRNRPTRHSEIAGQGSLYWIYKHSLVARSPILGFGEAEGGRIAIQLGLPLVRVMPRPRRAHQGWRYLDPADAPADLGAGGADEALPPELAGRLAGLGLL